MMPANRTVPGFREPRLAPRPIVEAVYRDPVVPIYQGNPFNEALPPIEEEETLPYRLAQRPPWDSQHTTLGARTRMHMIAQIRFVLQPMDMHFELTDKISLLLRSGYVGRNPVDPHYYCWLETAVAELEADLALPNLNVTGTGMGSAFIGPSGIGKTTAVAAILSFFPQAIQHVSFRGHPFICKQITWLHLECPQDASIKGLCIAFFEAVDLLIGSDYCGLFLSRSPSVDNLVVKMARVCALHGIGLLVIDEVQNLKSAPGGSDRKLLNYLVALMNRLRVPVLFVGTPKASRVLGQEFRQARRASSFGDVYWDRLHPGDDFDLLCETLLEYQYLKNRIPNRKDEAGVFSAITQALYEESQGIAALVSGLIMLAQIRALGAKKEILTPGLIRSVSVDCFRTVRPFLLRLKHDYSYELQDEIDRRIGELDFDLLGDLVFFEPRIRQGRALAARAGEATEVAAPLTTDNNGKEMEVTAMADDAPPVPACRNGCGARRAASRGLLAQLSDEATVNQLSPHQGLAVAGFIRQLGEEARRDGATVLP